MASSCVCSSRILTRIAATALAGAGLVACSRQDANAAAKPIATPPPAASAPAPQPTPRVAAQPRPLTPAIVNSAQLTSNPTVETATAGASTGDSAGSAGGAASAKIPDPVLIRAEVLLDRAKFSPGVVDGLEGENFSNALKAYEIAHKLPVYGRLKPEVWRALVADGAPVLITYTITPQDVAGPWAPDVGEDFVKLSAQKATGYHSAVELLAEKFHMDEALLKALNPGGGFDKAGTRIVVADPGPPTLSGQVKRIEVDKAKEQVRAYTADGQLLAVYPATVGSTTRPSPVGTFKVNGVSRNPDYMYDPAKLTWGPKHAGKLHIPAGPNNPVGLVWIALSAPDYGIHGSPDPRLIGKTASHGCVRLTNWDVQELASATKSGAKVVFLSGKASGGSGTRKGA